jgi:hypothetical protein
MKLRNIVRASLFALLLSTQLNCGSEAGPSEPLPPASLKASFETLTAQSRVPFSSEPTIQVVDADGVTVLQGGIVVNAAISGGEGELQGISTVSTTSSGIARFSNLAVAGAIGSFTISFSSSGLTGTTISVELTAGLPAALVQLAGEGQLGSTGAVLEDVLSVWLIDLDENPVQGVEVVFNLIKGGGIISAGTAQTDNAGVASSGSWTLGTAAGWNTAEASVSGPDVAGNPVSFSAYGFPEFSEVLLSGQQPTFATGVTFNRTRGTVTLAHKSSGLWEMEPTGGSWTQLSPAVPGSDRIYAELGSMSV